MGRISGYSGSRGRARVGQNRRMDRNRRSGAMRKIPLSRVFLNQDIREAAMRALESGSYILTKECEAFEAELADHTGTEQAVLCSSWTGRVFCLLNPRVVS